MSAPYQFSMRDAELADEAFIISAFDASQPYLESIGSVAQWGSVPFSQRPGWVEETKRQVQESEQNRLANVTDGLRILVLEAEHVEPAITSLDLNDLHSRVSDDERCFVSVGFAFVRVKWFPNYIPASIKAQAEPDTIEESLYVEVMVSDNRTKGLFHGVGSAILQELRNYGRSRGKKALYLDGWAGNERKLIQYYKQQDFQVVADFSLPRKHKNPWTGTLMRLAI